MIWSEPPRDRVLLNAGFQIHDVRDYTSANLGPNRPRNGVTMCNQKGKLWAEVPWARSGAPKSRCPKCEKADDRD